MSSTVLDTTTGSDQAATAPAIVTERDVRRMFSVMRRIAANPFVPVRPTPHQLAFLLAEEREVLFTGSGGCGKTVGLLMAGLLDVDRPGYGADPTSGAIQAYSAAMRLRPPLVVAGAILVASALVYFRPWSRPAMPSLPAPVNTIAPPAPMVQQLEVLNGRVAWAVVRRSVSGPSVVDATEDAGRTWHEIL
ncbi:MAG TPA: hypothetical protein VLW53_16780, partial [Candidatus Eisenbacteria bacterium]|nr:hypothetical protein [Candidatus Eisenbacteria bacterium]